MFKICLQRIHIDMRLVHFPSEVFYIHFIKTYFHEVFIISIDGVFLFKLLFSNGMFFDSTVIYKQKYVLLIFGCRLFFPIKPNPLYKGGGK